MRVAVVSHRELSLDELIDGLASLRLEITELVSVAQDPSKELIAWFTDRFGIYYREVSGYMDIVPNATGLVYFQDRSSRDMGIFLLLRRAKEAKLDLHIVREDNGRKDVT